MIQNHLGENLYLKVVFKILIYLYFLFKKYGVEGVHQSETFYAMLWNIKVIDIFTEMG